VRAVSGGRSSRQKGNRAERKPDVDAVHTFPSMMKGNVSGMSLPMNMASQP
jgi:hypothetical protein